jgi:hypothetical protein
VPPLRERVTTAYGALASGSFSCQTSPLLWAAAVVLQVFFPGLGIFGATSFDTHKYVRQRPARAARPARGARAAR